MHEIYIKTQFIKQTKRNLIGLKILEYKIDELRCGVEADKAASSSNRYRKDAGE